MRQKWHIAFLFLFVSSFTYGQYHDFGLWSGLAIKYKTEKDIRFSVSTESRFSENASFYEKQYYNAEIGYPATDAIDISASYRFGTENGVEKRADESSHRLSADVAGKTKFWRISTKARLRWQSKWADLNDPENNQIPENTIRLKIAPEYILYGSRFSPNASAEIFVPLGKTPDPISINKLRLSAGTDITVSKHASLNLAYLFQTDIFYYPKTNQHIATIGVSYKL